MAHDFSNLVLMKLLRIRSLIVLITIFHIDKDQHFEGFIV